MQQNDADSVDPGRVVHLEYAPVSRWSVARYGIMALLTPVVSLITLVCLALYELQRWYESAPLWWQLGVAAFATISCLCGFAFELAALKQKTGSKVLPVIGVGVNLLLLWWLGAIVLFLMERLAAA